MTTPQIKTAEALAPMLDGFHSIRDATLRRVWQVWAEGSLGGLMFDFGHVHLIVTADENDDTISIETEHVADPLDVPDIRRIDASHLPPWSDVIGKPFGWGWVTVNQQGYLDGLLLSFDTIVPQIALNVIASSIKVGTISIALQQQET